MLRGDCSIRTEGYGFSAEEIDACARRQELLLLELELSDSSQCNCPTCHDGAPQAVLSVDETRRLIDQAKSLGCRRVILVGGEQISHLKEVISHCRSADLTVELFLNHLRLDTAFLEFLKNKNVLLSLESTVPVQPELLEPLRGHLSAIRIAATGDNLNRIPDAWRWARTHGIEPHVQIITPRHFCGAA